MHVLIVYGTTEGHTRDLCHFAGERLRADGHLVAVEEIPSSRATPDPAPYDAALVAGSLHIGRYQPALVRFAKARSEALNAMQSAFISVSLAAAGVNPQDWEGLEQCLARFEHETGWTPKAVCHAAGAIRYSHYDFFKRLVLMHIARQRGLSTVPTGDYDLTDYEALTRFVTDFVAGRLAPTSRGKAGAAGAS